ncbi:hypothetical protein J1605_018908 [Eschrichtius robustus]|uniref:Uncharacterized protein n=1 Tax=Eschrichtius robustus TaxID=9764 RepID=A0AB34HTI9_ESCRO|nr:hypothetical protein J1605_018908 [Eschrichtius robustus]
MPANSASTPSGLSRSDNCTDLLVPGLESLRKRSLCTGTCIICRQDGCLKNRGQTNRIQHLEALPGLQLRPPQGRIPSPGSPIKYSEVVLDPEPKPQASSPEPELYASVCAQTRRARASFPDQAYANSQPAPS